MIPGFTVAPARAAPLGTSAPLVATEFPPLPPVDQGYAAPPSYPAYLAAAPHQPIGPQPYPVFYAPYPANVGASMIPPRATWQSPGARGGDSQRPDFFGGVQPIEKWDLGQFALAAFPARRSVPVPATLASAPAKPKLDRLQMTTWAQLRGDSNPGALASGGTLGGSQGGARLTYAFNRWLAASVRATTPLGGSRGAEIAGGVRLTPLRSVPVAITVERRQSVSHFGGGRSAFAVFAEVGLYRQPMPLDFRLDGYAQAGIVGFNSRDLFADGALTLTRPLWGRFYAGLGAWGGVQPGVYRVDAGPRLSIRLRDNIYAHADWRQRVAGSASPGSGPVLTLAADF